MERLKESTQTCQDKPYPGKPGWFIFYYIFDHSVSNKYFSETITNLGIFSNIVKIRNRYVLHSIQYTDLPDCLLYALTALLCILLAVWFSVHWVRYNWLVTEDAKNFMTCLNTTCVQNVGTLIPTAGGNIPTTVLYKIKKGNFLL
jgi:hypothetical protein